MISTRANHSELKVASVVATATVQRSIVNLIREINDQIRLTSDRERIAVLELIQDELWLTHDQAEHAVLISQAILGGAR